MECELLFVVSSLRVPNNGCTIDSYKLLIA
jgi:hypothetical protein